MADPTDPDASLETDYFGPATPDWVPDPGAETDGRRYVVVPVTKLYGDQLFGKPRGVRIDQGTNCWLRLVLYSEQTGAPLTISVGQYADPPAVYVRYREASGYDSRIFVPDDADVGSLSSDGKTVRLPLPIELKNYPGVYTAQVLVRGADGEEKNRSEFTVLVDRGLFLADGTAPSIESGPATMGEVRTVLRDHPGANRLLGDFEFDAAEIGASMVAAVQAFNVTHPAGDRSFSTINWPAAWRRHMLDGCLAYLFETAGSYHRRGHLNYNAAGLAVDDLNKEKDYLKASEIYRERYSKWCLQTKIRASIDAGWGSLTSGGPWFGTW